LASAVGCSGRLASRASDHQNGRPNGGTSPDGSLDHSIATLRKYRAGSRAVMRMCA
jgi:hypothetical protein